MEQRVPAFIVFSDSSLIDMCMKLPKTRDEFLEVSEVGQQKIISKKSYNKKSQNAFIAFCDFFI